MSGIWELPFGKNRRWGARWNSFEDAILGGWQLQAIWQAQDGRPLDLGNLYFNGDPSKLKVKISGSTVDAAFDTSGFYFTDALVQTNGVVDPAKQRNDPRIRLAFNLRTFPSHLSNFRSQPLNLWDISLIKNFLFTDATRLQLRGEFLNAFNHPQFNNPILDPTSTNFGRITSQANLPRNIQLGIKLIF
ncbi:MAG TPA: hypothetical protein VKB86_04665 [Pyrinomonadaceae bacterium]|nr:hypothetical protein [Pyrinomonadaceae bacterium]